MSAAVVVLLVVLVVLQGLALVRGLSGREWGPRGPLRSRMRQEALVTLKAGPTFSGVLWEQDRRALVLRNAVQHTNEATGVPVDGELLLLWADVAYVQMP